MKIIGAVMLTLLVLLPVRWQPGITAANDPKTERVVDAGGDLRVPGDYRTAYQFLGGWAVAADQGQGSKQIHVVYASPGAIVAYRKKGRFADGSVPVTEVFEATTGTMTTGTVSHAQPLTWPCLSRWPTPEDGLRYRTNSASVCISMTSKERATASIASPLAFTGRFRVDRSTRVRRDQPKRSF
jgi:hypothetical protein